MPGDSSPEDQARQQKHAQEIRMRRAVQKFFGVPYSELRTRLQAFGTVNQQIAFAAKSAPVSATNEPVQVRDIALGGKGFGGEAVGPTAQPQALMNVQTINVCINGQPGTMQVLGSPAVPL